jgi:DNA-binding transcriptional MocR family regulator
MPGLCRCLQVAVHSMLQAWGEQGYDAFLRKLQRQYGEMAALAHSECERQLAGLAVWHAVQAGMFMWYRLEGGAQQRCWGLCQ